MIWRDTEFEGYQVSDTGLVRNTKRNGFVYKNILCGHGYHYIDVKSKIGNKNIKVHRLVAQAFIPNRENKPFVNHINGIRNDNRVENLEWCTPKENSVHASQVLKVDFGKTRGRYRVTHNSKPVIAIHSQTGEERYFETQRMAARELGVSFQNIWHCLRGNQKTTGGYYFKPVDNETAITRGSHNLYKTENKVA